MAGFPGMTDAHTFSLDWQVRYPHLLQISWEKHISWEIVLQGNVYSKAAIAPHGSQTTKLIVATLNRKVLDSYWWLGYFQSKEFTWWFRCSASSCQCPIVRDLVAVLLSLSARSRDPDENFLTTNSSPRSSSSLTYLVGLKSSPSMHSIVPLSVMTLSSGYVRWDKVEDGKNQKCWAGDNY